MFESIIAITLLACFFGLLLGIAAIIFKIDSNPIVDEIDHLLPQTQCTQCSYAGCRPYAEAMAKGEAPINLCPPGGEQTIHALADLLDVEVLEAPEEEGIQGPTVALIIEKDCIGCTLCIQACPVDAIIGSAKQMHTVIESECTGCDLCLDPCPVDCIIMIPVKETPSTWKWPLPHNHINDKPIKNKRLEFNQTEHHLPSQNQTPSSEPSLKPRETTMVNS